MIEYMGSLLCLVRALLFTLFRAASQFLPLSVGWGLLGVNQQLPVHHEEWMMSGHDLSLKV
jgi:hypothetical protein